MSIGYNPQEDKYNERYAAWTANMLKASKARQWKKMVAMNRKSGYQVTVGIVGCLHWAYYSIMHYLGKGTYYQYALCYYEKGEDIPSDGLDFNEQSYKEGFYKTEGLFCISAVVQAIIVLFRKWLQNKVAVLGQTYDSGDALYLMLSRFTVRLSWVIAAILLFQLGLALKSLIYGRRFVKYLLNSILLLLLSTGFGVVEVLFLIGSALWYIGSEESRGVQYPKCYSAKNKASSHTVSVSSYSNEKNTAYEKRKREEEQWQKENDEYQKQRMEEKENRRREDQRNRLYKEIEGLKNKISILEKNNRDLDAGLRAYQKGSWSYSVDPKANRRKYEDNLKEIGWQKEKIEKLEKELRAL